MIFLSFSQTKLGRLNPNVRVLGGWGKYIFLVVSFLKIPAVALALRAWKQKGKKEGGWGEGIFALLRIKIERFRFSLIKRNTKQKNFLFLLKEKIAREKIKKCRETFSVLFCRSGAEASGNAPHSCSGFSLKKVRISFRVRSQIVCSAFVASPLRGPASALRALRPDFERICHAPRGSKNNSRSRKIRFAVVKQQNPANGGIANLFFSPVRASCKAIILAQKRYY